VLLALLVLMLVADAGNGTLMDAPDDAYDGGELDDGCLYRRCQVGSYGDIVACDDNDCEREKVSVVLFFGKRAGYGLN